MSTPAITPEDEVFEYLDKNVFQPALSNPKASTSIKAGVHLTRTRLRKLSAFNMIKYFWSALHGTDRSIRFAENMKKIGLTRFEDVLEEFRVKFGDDYINKLPRW